MTPRGSRERSAGRSRAARALAPLLAASALGASCANLSVERTTATSGRFRSSGIAVTFLSIDMPRQAMQIARENASDMGLPNLQVEDSSVTPYFGMVDWLLDIVGIRYAVVTGTFGIEPKHLPQPAAAVAPAAPVETAGPPPPPETAGPPPPPESTPPHE